MAAAIAGVFQPEMQNLIKESKVLLVGAGGIGCEVLKNLVLTGFSELEIIDLDTIEVSNLNRQFLFNKESVGKAKSHVAKISVLKFNPNVNITSHLGDIMDTKYGVAFFNKFKLVINALDNKKARSHVNRMCLSCDIPLIESGTMGYSGQVEFIKKGVSLCYECYPKSEPKSYPMCTIRNTPKEPIHCIVWSKFLFGQLFGESDEDVSMDEAISQDSSETMSARNWAIKNEYNPRKLLKKVFYDDIQYLLSMEHLYVDKKIKPVLLDEALFNQERVEYSHVPDSELLTLIQCVSMFLDCITPIKQKLEASKNRCLVWDKDDDDFMNFVVSSSNIRSAIFNIPFKSHFDIKSMAGNIIPAIATANAIIAGQIVIHALRILRGKYERCQSVFLRGMPNHKGAVLVKDKFLEKPNPKCMVCTTDGEIILSTDINNLTVKQFEELVLKKKLNVVAPDVLVDGRMIISSDEADEVDLYEKTLAEVGVSHGSRFSVDDYFQNYSIKIMLFQKEKSEEEDPDFEIFGNLEEMNKANKLKNNIAEAEENDEDCLIEKDESSADKVDGGKLKSNEQAQDMNTDKEQADDSIIKEDIMDSDPEVVEMDQEISNEEILATKRKANEAIEDVNGAKKSRID
ncbi:SUMO-activating enzyme subunit 2 [Melanaphis sacchari]|uniref:SUMO-activating enzyme subunit n=1 Tax=Melanaphis sacchari TaxID=742174 RepID=A0A2H8TM62_9HEMI|nr:SUMO-activating enzyme subunit 2 [Melanaphis sacchari]